MSAHVSCRVRRLLAVAGPAHAATSATGCRSLARLRARRGLRARTGRVRGAPQGLGGVGPRRSGRGRGGAARGRGGRERSPAPVRAYAGLLEAYARRAGATWTARASRIARLGYVGNWMLVGPFDNDGKAGLGRGLRPGEGAERAAQPHPRLRRQGAPARALAAVAGGVALRLGRLRRVRATRRAGRACYADDVRARRTPEGHARAPDLGVGRGDGRAARLLERRRDPARREVPRPRPRPVRRRGVHVARGVEPADREGLRRRARADAVAPAGRRRRRARRRSIEVDADPRHSTPEESAAQRSERRPGGAAARECRRAGAGVRAARARATTRRCSRRSRATSARPAPTTRPSTAPASSRARPRTRRRPSRGSSSPASWPRAATSAPRGSRRPRRWSTLGPRDAARRRSTSLLARAALRARRASTGATRFPTTSRSSRSTPTTCPRRSRRSSFTRRRACATRRCRVLELALSAPAAKRGAAARDGGGAARRGAARPRPTRWPSATRPLRFDDPAFARARIDLAVARRDAATAARWIDRLARDEPGQRRRRFRRPRRRGSRLGEQRPRHRDVPIGARPRPRRHRRDARSWPTVYALCGRARRAAPPAQARARADAAGEGRPRGGGAHRAGPAATRRAVRATRERVPRQARRPASDGQARRSLVDLQVTTVFPNGLASRFHQVVYQPLTDASAAESREYEFVVRDRQREPCSFAPRAFTARTGRSTRPSRAARARWRTTRRWRCTRARASYYVRFPRLEPGDVVELQYRVEDVAPRNAFADYFGEVVYMQSGEPIARSEYVLMTPKARDVPLQRAARSRACSRSVEERGDQRIFHFLALDVPAVHAGAAAAAVDRAARRTCTSRRTRRGTRWARWYWGLVKDQFVAGRRGAAARRGAHEGPEGRAREGPRDLRLRRPEDAVRRSRVRHPRLQAVPVRADLRARASATAKTRRRSS